MLSDRFLPILVVLIVAACSQQRAQLTASQANDVPPPTTPVVERGLSSAIPAEDCADALSQHGNQSSTYWVQGSTSSIQVFCEQVIEGGGWAMLYNSVANQDTIPFWQISYAQRLARKGIPSIDRNFYDPELYTADAEYLDVIVDLQGRAAIASRARAASFNSQTMKLVSPVFISGVLSVYYNHMAGGWSSHDSDQDQNTAGNCARWSANVAQPYGDCWVYNLGADADATTTDGDWGPHANTTVLTQLGLSNDGSAFSRVLRITRFVR